MARFPTDPQITLAARALAAGDLLGTLNYVALRNDAPALALRGIAMARLGDFERAQALLKRAVRAFGPQAPIPQARCVVALTEIALITRDLGGSMKALSTAGATLEAHGDRFNAAHARHLEIRRLLLLGRVHEAKRMLAGLNPAPFPPALRAAHELVVAGLAIRGLQIKAARMALVAAARAADETGIPALRSEVAGTALVLERPAARVVSRGKEQRLRLDEVEAFLKTKTLVVDGCRHLVRGAATVVSLAKRPVLFALARALAEAWPGDVTRSSLIAQAFQAKTVNESHRARLRVEIGRLRKALNKLTGITATLRGFALTPHHAREVAVLAWPVDEEHAAVLGFLSDGEAWSSSALAVALGTSQRTVQRALDALAATGKIQALGQARARRWIMPVVPEFATILLLPGPLPVG
ncbi:MAG: hypothetical protein QM796_19225 [Chthoniobacteraceae bacterium]